MTDKKLFKRSKYCYIYTVYNNSDSHIWTHREFFRSKDLMADWIGNHIQKYVVVSILYKGTIKQAPKKLFGVLQC